MNINLDDARTFLNEWSDSHTDDVSVTIDTNNLLSDVPGISVDVTDRHSEYGSYCFNLHSDGVIRNAEYDEDSSEEERERFEIVIDDLLQRLHDVFGLRTVKGLFLEAATGDDTMI